MNQRPLVIPRTIAVTVLAMSLGACAPSPASDAASDAVADATEPGDASASCVCGPNCSFVSGEVMCPAQGGGLCRPPPGCAIA
ncbi:MAG: hypothetical protein JNK05_38365 [Myxococcales bacterium]|nr:hypothetical protein [Myxococcales bacterium]